MKIKGGRSKKPRRCQVDGCKEAVPDTPFYMRAKCCAFHAKQGSVQLAGGCARFCFFCRKFHGLEEFDGNKRNCRAGLEVHSARRVVRRTAKAAAMGPSNRGSKGAASRAASGAASGALELECLPQADTCTPTPPAAALSTPATPSSKGQLLASFSPPSRAGSQSSNQPTDPSQSWETELADAGAGCTSEAGAAGPLGAAEHSLSSMAGGCEELELAMMQGPFTLEDAAPGPEDKEPFEWLMDMLEEDVQGGQAQEEQRLQEWTELERFLSESISPVTQPQSQPQPQPPAQPPAEAAAAAVAAAAAAAAAAGTSNAAVRPALPAGLDAALLGALVQQALAGSLGLHTAARAPLAQPVAPASLAMPQVVVIAVPGPCCKESHCTHCSHGGPQAAAAQQPSLLPGLVPQAGALSAQQPLLPNIDPADAIQLAERLLAMAGACMQQQQQQQVVVQQQQVPQVPPQQ